MKIMLINVVSSASNYDKKPNLFFLTENFFYKQSLFYPINFLILASLTPEEHTVKINNFFKYSDLDFDNDFDLIGLSCMTNYAPEAYKIADEFRRRGKTVVLGGYHPSAIPEEAKQHADSVVVGEAEYIWLQLIQDCKNNKLKPFYYQNKTVEPKDIPVFNQNLLDKKFRMAGIQATRGCYIGCEFCSITNQRFGKIFRLRPIENVIKEVESVPQKTINFHDASLSLNTNYTKELFKAMTDFNKKFRCWINANISLNDDDFFKLASEAGCVMMEIGFESFSQETIDFLSKKTNKVDLYKKLIKKIHDFGIAVGGTFVFGFDTDSIDVFDNTLQQINSLGIDLPRFSILTPYPGTPIYDRLEKENRILTHDWSKYDMSEVVFQPKNMTPEELFVNSYMVQKETYSVTNMSKRILAPNDLQFSSKVWAIFSNIWYGSATKKVIKERFN